MMSTVKNYLSLVKFSHTIFAMPFAMIGFFLAFTDKQWFFSRDSLHQLLVEESNTYLAALKLFLLVIICMVTARSAAMAFNRYLDRSFDAKNPRTAIREIPKGIISANNALRFVILNCGLFITATYFINSICFYLSPVALFVPLPILQ